MEKKDREEEEKETLRRRGAGEGGERRRFRGKEHGRSRETREKMLFWEDKFKQPQKLLKQGK